MCLAIVVPPSVRNHLSEGMWIAALRHPEMARELAVLQVVVSSTTEFTLGCLLNKTFWVDVLDELVTEFWKQEDQRLCLERPGMMVYNLLLGPPSDRARLADRLEEATERLGAEQPT
jgi:hypothetical protein